VRKVSFCSFVHFTILHLRSLPESRYLLCHNEFQELGLWPCVGCFWCWIDISSCYTFFFIQAVSRSQCNAEVEEARPSMWINQLEVNWIVNCIKPMPPYNPLFGHLGFAYKINSKLPKDAHPNYLPDMIRRELPDLGPVFYLDTWPFGPQMLVVASLSALHQVTQKHSLPKYHAMKSFLHPIADGLDIVTMEGQLWKKWRGIFNPGFSTNHLMTLTSEIVEETAKFCDILEMRLRDQNIFRFKDLTDFLAMDVIGRVVM